MHVSNEESVDHKINNNINNDSKEPETDYLIIRSPEYVVWTCPFCGTENCDNFSTFDFEEIYEGHESSYCCYCNKEVKLNGICDYD